MSFHERKQSRTEYYYKYIYRWKQRRCTACNGSGRYDSSGSPPCDACEGSGKESYDSISYLSRDCTLLNRRQW